jgi:hypothetical protein
MVVLACVSSFYPRKIGLDNDHGSVRVVTGISRRFRCNHEVGWPTLVIGVLEEPIAEPRYVGVTDCGGDGGAGTEHDREDNVR